jgi:hypothetical protein
VDGNGDCSGFVALIIDRFRDGRGAKGFTEAHVRRDVESFNNNLPISLSSSRETVARRSGESLTAEWKFVPAWAVVVAVILFPIGLLALIARRTSAGTTIAEQLDSGTVHLRPGGEFNAPAVRAIKSVIES